MATLSGNSSGSTQNLQNSGSEGDLQMQGAMNERKRKRMQSNRESARRSRMRKQKHLDDMVSQVAQLRNDNAQILNNINHTTQHYLNVERENSVLRAQVMELTHRLQSLDDMLASINSIYGIFDSSPAPSPEILTAPETFMSNPWMYLNQPIMASADAMFQC
nr:bZIP transcription factor 11-like [Ipomoea batatas]GMD93768.1 bZIP transcription factor 11-like [Ipomoea batatas]